MEWNEAIERLANIINFLEERCFEFENKIEKLERENDTLRELICDIRGGK